jgi:fused signal recognition particle receptor
MHGRFDKLRTMALSIFGRRNEDDERPEAMPQDPPQNPSDAPHDAAGKPRSLFDRMRQAVTRTRDSLSSSLAGVVALTREVDDASLDDLELALLAADIGSPTTVEIMTRLRDRALRQGIASGAELRDALKAEIERILASVQQLAAKPAAPPEVVMMVGVNGTGKTTTTGKLAALWTREGRSVLLCAADTFRAAAIEQLEVWATRSGVEMIRTRQGGDPSAALYDALAAARARQVNTLIVDTAGRLHTKTDLMKELDKMRRTAQKLVPDAPHQVLLVIDATTGQNGLQQARLFTEAAQVTGIVLTKLDGTAKGGVVVAIAHEMKLPVLYVGVGEKMEDLLPFDAAAFVEGLLGS